MGKIMRNGVQYGNPAIPYASNNVPGLVKIGNGLSIDGNGVLSADPATIPSLGDLTDVDLTTPPASGDVLGFNGSDWVPQTPSSGGGGVSIVKGTCTTLMSMSGGPYMEFTFNVEDASKPFTIVVESLKLAASINGTTSKNNGYKASATFAAADVANAIIQFYTNELFFGQGIYDGDLWHVPVTNYFKVVSRDTTNNVITVDVWPRGYYKSLYIDNTGNTVSVVNANPSLTADYTNAADVTSNSKVYMII